MRLLFTGEGAGVFDDPELRYYEEKLGVRNAADRQKLAKEYEEDGLGDLFSELQLPLV